MEGKGKGAVSEVMAFLSLMAERSKKMVGVGLRTYIYNKGKPRRLLFRETGGTP